MANQIIVYTPTLNKWIAPRYEEYRFLHGGPLRVGDVDEIDTPTRKRVRVMLCEVPDTVKPGLWLVEVNS